MIIQKPFLQLLVAFFLIYFTGATYTDVSAQSVLIDTPTTMPCSTLFSAPALTDGLTVFSDAQVPLGTVSIQQLTITSMFIPQGFHNQMYTLFSIIDRATLQLIYSASYNPTTNTISHLLKGTVQSISITPTAAIQNKWCYIKSIISLDANGVTDTVEQEFAVEEIFSQSTTFTYSAGGGITCFNRNQLLFDIGYSSKILNYSPACAKVRYMVIYLTDQQLNDAQFSLSHSKKSLSIQRILHYDYFYNYLSSTTNIIIYSLDSGYTGDGQYQNLVSFMFDRQYSNEQLGYSVSMLVKIWQDTYQYTLVYFTQELTLIAYLNVKITPSNYLILTDNLGIIKATSSVALIPDSWYRFVIILDDSPISTKATVFFTQSGSLYSISFNLKVRVGYFVFGGQVPVTKINYISIYWGTFFVETLDCYIQTARGEKNCLLCKQGYVLRYQTGFECVASGSIAMDGLTATWSRSHCANSFRHTGYGSVCYPTFGYYSNLTLRCPKEFQGCRSQTDPLKKDPRRDQFSLKCQTDLYDDGYFCITKVNNIAQQIEVPMSTSFTQHYITQSLMQLISGQSIFVSFKLKGFNSPLVDINECICYVSDSSQMIFLIAIKFDTSRNIAEVIYYYLSNEVARFEFNSKQEVKIGLWATEQKAVPIISTAVFMQESILLTPIIIWNYPNLLICVGECFQSNPMFTPSKRIVSPDSISFIKGSLEERVATESIMAIPTPPKLILFFQSKIQIQFPINITLLTKIKDFPSLSNTTLKFYGTIHQNLGGNLGNTSPAEVSSGFDLGSMFSISLHIQIESVYTNNIMYFTLSSTIKIRIRIFLMFAWRYVQICANGVCLLAKYCTIEVNVMNYLLIQFRNFRQDTTKILQLEARCVCNYITETLRFMEPFSISSYSVSLIQFFPSISTAFYFTNIRFFKDLDFIIDYSDSDDCFLYDSLFRCCIKAKIGMALWNCKAVPPEMCAYQQSESNTCIIYNQKTGECEDSGKYFPKCQVLNPIDLVTCNVCKDFQLALSEAQCDCPAGYYYPNNSFKCQPCHPKCGTCSGNANTCTSCKYQGTVLPDCNCVISTQFLDGDYKCQECSEKCLICSGSADTCLSCAINRVDPPICTCNPSFFDQTFSTSDICVPLNCSEKCDGCLQSSDNCVSCAIWRTLPPTCNCQFGRFELNGICETCPTHQFYNVLSGSCEECSNNCQECEENDQNCTECNHTLFLVETECLCSDFLYPIKQENDTYECPKFMEVSLELTMQPDSSITLVFTFTSDLDEIDFSVEEIDSLLFIYIDGVNSNSFTTRNPQIFGPKLSLELSFQELYSATFGCSQFISIKDFKNSQQNVSLNHKYLQDTFNFDFGPIVLRDGIYTPNSILISLKDTIQSTDNTINYIIQQLSIACLLINTLQPMMVFFLLKVDIPPNIYQLLSTFASLMFPYVQEYNKQHLRLEYSILGVNMEAETDFKSNSSSGFQKIGFSNNLLFNIPVMILQNLIWPTILGIIYIIKEKLKKKVLSTPLQKLESISSSQVISVTESSLLVTVVSIANQLCNIQSEMYFNRLSFYLAIFLAFVLYSRNVSLYKQLKSHFKQKTEITESLFEKYDVVNQRKRTGIILFIMGQRIKKLMLALALGVLDEIPILICYFYMLCLLISVIATYQIKPYKNPFLFLVRMLGDLSQFVVVCIYIFQFIPLQSTISQGITNQIEESKFDIAINYGLIAIWAFLFLNFVYLLEFAVSMVEKIRQKLKAKRQSQEQPNS